MNWLARMIFLLVGLFVFQSNVSAITGGNFWDGAKQGATSGAVSGAGYGVLKGHQQANKVEVVEEVKIQKHHSDPKFIGGEPKQPLTPMKESDHKALHKSLNKYLIKQVNETGNHMRPQRGNSGFEIRNNFTRLNLLKAMSEYYKGPGAIYKNAANDFFKQHPNLK